MQNERGINRNLPRPSSRIELYFLSTGDSDIEIQLVENVRWFKVMSSIHPLALNYVSYSQILLDKSPNSIAIFSSDPTLPKKM
jgi:hypothetical protein